MKNKGKKQVENINNSNEKLLLSDVSGSKICPNCSKKHNSDEWNGYCSKICWWGFSVD